MPQKVRMKARARTSHKIVLDFHALFNEPARLEDYAALSIPTLLLCGDRSPAPSCRIVEMLASAMPHARVVRIQNAGHMSPFTPFRRRQRGDQRAFVQAPCRDNPLGRLIRARTDQENRARTSRLRRPPMFSHRNYSDACTGILELPLVAISGHLER